MNLDITTIALDAHGTDHNTQVIIDGARRAIEELNVNVILVGDKAEIENHLGSKGWSNGLLHEQASQIIEMCEEPASAVRKKTESSIVVSARLVKEGKAQAMVGAGNTGAMMAAALLTLGRISGVSRPGIAVELPAPGSEHGSTTRQILMDAGATIDTEPQWLYQHALIARAYVQHRLGIDEPTIGLLSNGEESSKGDELRKLAYPLLQTIPGFIGNCEGSDLLTGNPTIVLTDGFTGNVALKTIESTAKSIFSLVLGVLTREENHEASAMILPSLLESVGAIHPDTYGGAVLLGINNPVVISHGASNSDAIYNAIRVADECIRTNVVNGVRNIIESK